jgi:hypothetical protein
MNISVEPSNIINNCKANRLESMRKWEKLNNWSLTNWIEWGGLELSMCRLQTNNRREPSSASATPGFRKTNQLHTYMYVRIKFHTYSRYKWITVTVSRKEHKQNLLFYQSYTAQSWKRRRQLHKQSTGGCVRLASTPSSTASHLFLLSNSLQGRVHLWLVLGKATRTN